MTSAVPAPYLELRETHCAGLLLVGDRVLKFKKPVDLGFLDFSTPTLRAEACRRSSGIRRITTIGSRVPPGRLTSPTPR